MALLDNIMGMLGQSFGNWTSQGSGTASGAANNALALGTLATGTNVLGNLFSGIGAAQQAGFASDVARQNAQSALEAGQNAESQSKMRYGALEAKQTVGAAANGVGVNSGSATAVRNSTQEISAMDAALIHYNAARQSYAEGVQSSLDKRASTQDIFKGLYGAGASFLSGASSVSDKYLGFKMSGALQSPGSNPMTIPQTASDPTFEFTN
jgi:hypothetical protein